MRWVFILLTFSSSLFASPVGNPATPGLLQSGFFGSCNPWIKVTSGYLTEYVSRLPLQLTSGHAEFNPDQAFEHFGLHSQMASFSVVLLQRLETYALLGGSKEHLKWRDASETSLFSSLFDFKTDYHFSWALGGRVVLLQWGQTFFTVDGNYFDVPASSKSFFRFLNRLSLPLDKGKQSYYLREWQAGVSLASRFWIFTPYAGVKYMNAKLHIDEGPESSSLVYRNRKKVGYFCGLTLSITSKFLITAERRVKDEFAYMFSTEAVF